MTRALIRYNRNHRTLFRVIGTLIALPIWALLLPFLFIWGLYETFRPPQIHKIGPFVVTMVRPPLRNRLYTLGKLMISPFVIVFDFDNFAFEVLSADSVGDIVDTEE